MAILCRQTNVVVALTKRTGGRLDAAEGGVEEARTCGKGFIVVMTSRSVLTDIANPLYEDQI
jgi:hypothetical protein